MKPPERGRIDSLNIFKGDTLAWLCFPLLLLGLMQSVVAQHNFNISDPVYGSDPMIINGRYYSFFLPSRTEGNQYLTDPRFDTGSVTVRGTTYSDLLLNYDIYNQQLLLKFSTPSGADNLIIISEAWLEGFSFKGMIFSLIPLQDTVKQIFQIVGDGHARIGYLWRKDLKPDSFYGARYYSFSLPRREMNILDGNSIGRYRNNKTFCEALDERSRRAVREYLTRRRINVKRAADGTMGEVMSFYNSIREE